jgi:hypothetical protein
MAKPKVTATNQLSNVIEVVELGQRTGMLMMERGSGSVLEEGEIYFEAGRACYASLAGLRGREALAALGRWGACRFAFERDVPPPLPNLTSPQPAIPPIPQSYPAQPIPGAMRMVWQNTNSGRGYVGGTDGAHPGQLHQQASRPLGGMEGSGVWEMPRGATPSAGDSGVYGWPRNGDYPAGATNNGNGLAGVASSQHRSQPQRVAQVPAGDAVLRRPRRAPDVRDLMIVVNTHGLSRSHRTILLLADGHHTVLDLARLSSKAVEEVAALLEELERKGLVYYYE